MGFQRDTDVTWAQRPPVKDSYFSASHYTFLEICIRGNHLFKKPDYGYGLFIHECTASDSSPTLPFVINQQHIRYYFLWPFPSSQSHYYNLLHSSTTYLLSKVKHVINNWMSALFFCPPTAEKGQSSLTFWELAIFIVSLRRYASGDNYLSLA